ncbi:hypothetical protein [Streptomyces sp. HF10]|uniref:hypothetical protein n=1 Tax=Streptomyces sp. HF10 TaxID=2692233 RepID=UPI0013197952|nr:hypothetical protein [Streptomyces sp. HF10]QHC29908.1 hypothetical protein GR129_14845 [Streptomyces sp. HF10]
MSEMRERAVPDQLAAGEQLLAYASVVPAAGAKGVSVNLGGVLASDLMSQVGAQGGVPGGIASQCPQTSGRCCCASPTSASGW